jgi:succinate dehydrogenase/fumarate reductase flavoprotein subunit
MTEALEASVKAKKIKIFNRMQIIKILINRGSAAGLVCLDLAVLQKGGPAFVVFLSANIVWASGGPADIYADRVYPARQHGAAGAAYEAGAAGRNLTEWQYGLASVMPRWNVSGTYMQVLPRFVSVGPDGDEREILNDRFESPGEMLSMVFLKGYQWPFDVRKIEGSSIIDMHVYDECRQGRKVFLDFTRNPLGVKDIDYTSLGEEARAYLSAAGACFGTPVQRLIHMNKPALDFYLDHGVDLRKEKLEIKLCAQHNNGGLAVDYWWQSNIKGLFPVGEAAGTHGIYRPGGSALNAGQAGALRAALYIANKRASSKAKYEDLRALVEKEVADIIGVAEKAMNSGKDNARDLVEDVQKSMSLCGGPFRKAGEIQEMLREIKSLMKSFASIVGIGKVRDLPLLFRLRDIITTQFVYLSAMESYIKENGKSRGSALYFDDASGKPMTDEKEKPLIQEIVYKNGGVRVSCREPRPIPTGDDFFENVWNEYRKHRNII